jgi:hypothetical protein
MAQQYPLLARSKRIDRPHLFVSLYTDGNGFLENSVEFLDESDPRPGFRFKSNGVPLIVPTDQLPKLRGAILDYQDTPFRTTIIVNLADE